MDIKSYLTKKAISPVAFADTIGVSQSTLYRYMAGERLPRPRTLARIVSATHGEVQPTDFAFVADEQDAAA